MYYQIITETGEIYIAERNFMNTKLTVTFKDIPEDCKEQQLDYAAYLRFSKYYEIVDNVANCTTKISSHQYLKLIPQSDDKVILDVPSLLLSI
jgi:hypothetical protein